MALIKRTVASVTAKLTKMISELEAVEGNARSAQAEASQRAVSAELDAISHRNEAEAAARIAGNLRKLIEG